MKASAPITKTTRTATLSSTGARFHHAHPLWLGRSGNVAGELDLLLGAATHSPFPLSTLPSTTSPMLHGGPSVRDFATSETHPSGVRVWLFAMSPTDQRLPADSAEPLTTEEYFRMGRC
jgi:hypothetical protein